MNATELRHIREQRRLTRKELGEQLSVSASAIVNWEMGTRSIPHWVEEKLLKSTPVTLPIEELALLLKVAAKDGISFETLLVRAIRDYLRRQI